MFTSIVVALGATAGTVGATVDEEGAGSSQHTTRIGVAPPISTTPSDSGSDRVEATGTATASPDGSSVIVTRADGSSIACSVPVAFDPAPYLSGRVEVQCSSVNGRLTLSEIKNDDTGADARPGGVEPDSTVGDESGEDCSAAGSDESGEDCAATADDRSGDRTDQGDGGGEPAGGSRDGGSGDGGRSGSGEVGGDGGGGADD